MRLKLQWGESMGKRFPVPKKRLRESRQEAS